MSYIDKLRDPRWQKKRLEIMARDNFTCLECGSTRKTLNVHHKRYLIDKDPWEYPAEDYKTICETCHEREESSQRSIEKKKAKNLGMSLVSFRKRVCVLKKQARLLYAIRDNGSSEQSGS